MSTNSIYGGKDNSDEDQQQSGTAGTILRSAKRPSDVLYDMKVPCVRCGQKNLPCQATTGTSAKKLGKWSACLQCHGEQTKCSISGKTALKYWELEIEHFPGSQVGPDSAVKASVKQDVARPRPPPPPSRRRKASSSLERGVTGAPPRTRRRVDGTGSSVAGPSTLPPRQTTRRPNLGPPAGILLPQPGTQVIPVEVLYEAAWEIENIMGSEDLELTEADRGVLGIIAGLLREAIGKHSTPLYMYI